jgi:hypothetical protein
MTTKTLLTITSVVETSTGLGLAIAPSALTNLLLGWPLEGSSSLVMARILAAALVAIGAMCWFAKDETQSRAILVGLTFYNGAAVVILAYAFVILKMTTIAAPLGVLLHATLFVACMRKRTPITSNQS